MTGDTVEWFSKRGVPIKIEEDGRMFLESNTSKTIIDCFLAEVDGLHIPVLKNHGVKKIQKENNNWLTSTEKGEFVSDTLVITTGSNTKIWNLLAALGHTIIPPVPSLFTFNIQDERINNLSVISTNAFISVISKDHKTILISEGALLITHWGLSGPTILKLSAWGAKELHELS